MLASWAPKKFLIQLTGPAQQASVTASDHVADRRLAKLLPKGPNVFARLFRPASPRVLPGIEGCVEELVGDEGGVVGEPRPEGLLLVERL